MTTSGTMLCAFEPKGTYYEKGYCRGGGGEGDMGSFFKVNLANLDETEETFKRQWGHLSQTPELKH